MALRVNQYRYKKDTAFLAYNGSISYSIDGNKLELSRNFSIEEKYYIKIKIKANTEIDRIKVYLKDRQNNKRSQYLEDWTVGAKQNEIFYLEIVATPDSDYSTILLQIGENESLVILDENILIVPIKNVIEDFEDTNSIIKMGIQGPPGLLMCINGEGIRIGPEGVYEIKDKYKITFMGFAIQKRNLSDVYDGRYYFILDYQYDEEG